MLLAPSKFGDERGFFMETFRADAWAAEGVPTQFVQLVPVGFGHGFCVTSEIADFVYKVTSYYEAATVSGFRFDDPDVGIEWPDVELLYSERDGKAPRLAEIADELPF